ncbi:uncharacterized protein LOC117653394 [Thrips palmi]|uniref:Uncharacterized protein LOC117653394 n=1 Tax=Thrips palmi TaxID=161013 RepID=A0A6P9AC38_THRPL|nr:uncharacterized protein LOC117653394 [Thrips palmi]
MVFAACPATDSLDSLKVTVEVFPLAPGKPPVLVQLGADPADTVETLRWGAVFKSTPIPKGHRAIGLVAQNPSFGLFMEDRELPLKGTVAECGITSGARLCFRRRDSDLDSRKMQIFVKFMRSTTAIQCFEWDTVQAVKDRVGLETASKEMYLMMRAPLEDELTLCESGVGDQSFLHLMLRIRGGGSSSSSVGAAQPAGQAQAGPEGAQPIASATPPAQPTDTLAVGKIVAGKFLPPEKTRTCHFHIDDEGPAPKLQFDIFVDEA